MTFKSINPFDLSVVGEYEVFTDSEVNTALDKSAKAFRDWRKTSFAHRADLLKNISRILLENKEKYAALITTEMGKAIAESRKEIEKSAGHCQFFAENTEKMLADEVIPSNLHSSRVVFDPIGCVFAIMPWNFPFWQVFRYAAKTLMAGNVTILKHAPNVCGCAKAIENIFLEAGFPEGVFQSIIIDIPQVEGIIASNIVQGVTLTGSEYAGSSVAAIAGKHIKKTVLELGGSDAFIVLADADLDKAVKVATQSRFINAGQACNNAKRFIVIDSIKEAFVEKFEANIRNLKQGNPFDEGIQLGPLARLDLAQKIENQINQSVSKGAKAILHGEAENCHVKPSLLQDIHAGMPAFDEEMFGPVASIISVKNEQEAIEIANNHRYGLDASIWTKDLELAYRMARDLEAGGVFVNTLVSSNSMFPFGGIKKSGYGRELSVYGLKEFVNIKTVLMEE